MAVLVVKAGAENINKVLHSKVDELDHI